MIEPTIKFVAIVGPTATGKSALAMQLAREFDGEIICADSRTLYRGMDIGTAKPTREERELVPHHTLDLLDPGEMLSAGAYKQLAEGAINDIAGRGRLPLLVGGSGLYADAVLFDYEFPPAADAARREVLDGMNDGALLEMLASEDPEAFARVDKHNRRRVIRAIETAGQISRRRADILPQALVLGTMLNKEIVQKRVLERIEKMLEQGFIDEVRTIGEHYGWDNATLDVIGYRAFKDVVLGTKPLAEGVADFASGDMALYKKQVTWFKRNQSIRWVQDELQARQLVQEFLS